MRSSNCVALATTAWVIACSAPSPAPDARATDAAAGFDAQTRDAAPLQARVRLMHGFQPGFLAVDFCLGTGGHWSGPALAGMYNLGGFQTVSPYAPVRPGSYTLRLISATSDTCDAAIEGVADLPLTGAFSAGGAYTVAVTGDVAADAATPAATHVFGDAVVGADGAGQLRVVNLAAATGTLDIARVTNGGPPVPLFLGVVPGAVGRAPATGGAAGPSDADGYVTLPAGDPYFYYDLRFYPAGGDPQSPTLHFHETGDDLLAGAWSIFLFNRPDTGALGYTLCRDDGATDTSHCLLR